MIETDDDYEFSPEVLTYFKSFATRDRLIRLRIGEDHRRGVIDGLGLRRFVRYAADLEYKPQYWAEFEVSAEEYRIIGEYEQAVKRQEAAEEAAAAARWNPPRPPPPPREPEPEEIPSGGKLTPRQQEFCRHYAAQPVALRGAASGHARRAAGGIRRG